MNNPELREQTASQLQSAVNRAGQMTAFVGLDGFVDEILHVVDKLGATPFEGKRPAAVETL